MMITTTDKHPGVTISHWLILNIKWTLWCSRYHLYTYTLYILYLYRYSNLYIYMIYIHVFTPHTHTHTHTHTHMPQCSVCILINLLCHNYTSICLKDCVCRYIYIKKYQVRWGNLPLPRVTCMSWSVRNLPTTKLDCDPLTSQKLTDTYFHHYIVPGTVARKVERTRRSDSENAQVTCYPCIHV